MFECVSMCIHVGVQVHGECECECEVVCLSV